MNITEIARKTGINRISTAKYLEMLVISGHIDVKTFGPSKVYFLSERLPISAMLSLSSDFIIILDKDLRIINVNDNFLHFTDLMRSDVLNKKIDSLSFPIKFDPPITANVVAAMEGKELSVEASYKNSGQELFFSIKFIPLVFDDGQKGVIILLEDITERKRTELDIKERELKLRSIIEQSRDGIILTDERGLIIEYNKGAEAIFGLSRDKMIGTYIWDFQAMHDIGLRDNPDRLAKVKSMLSDVLNTGRLSGASHLRETRIACQDNTQKCIQVSNFSIKTEKGYMICGIMRDITEQRRSEQAIRDSEEKFRNVIEQSLDGIMLIDNAGTIIEFSKGVEYITGMNARNNIGKKLWDTEFVPLVSGEHNSDYRTEAGLNNLKNFILEYIKTGISPMGITSFEVTFIRPDREKRVVLVNYSPICSQKGNMICMIARDITERNREEEEQHRVRDTYRSLIELVNDGIWEVDRNLVVTYINPQLCAMVEKKEDDIIGKSLIDILSPEAAEVFSKSIIPIMTARKKFRNVVFKFISGHHREIMAEISGIPVFGENGEFQGYRGVARNITGREREQDPRY